MKSYDSPGKDTFAPSKSFAVKIDGLMTWKADAAGIRERFSRAAKTIIPCQRLVNCFL
jgi:hypothetical protein